MQPSNSGVTNPPARPRLWTPHRPADAQKDSSPPHSRHAETDQPGGLAVVSSRSNAAWRPSPSMLAGSICRQTFQVAADGPRHQAHNQPINQPECPPLRLAWLRATKESPLTGLATDRASRRALQSRLEHISEPASSRHVSGWLEEPYHRLSHGPARLQSKNSPNSPITPDAGNQPLTTNYPVSSGKRRVDRGPVAHLFPPSMPVTLTAGEMRYKPVHAGN